MKTLRCLFFLFVGLTTVTAQIPEGYYSTAEGFTGEELKTALYHIIKGHTEYPYTSSSMDTWDILKEADRDPDNPNNVLGIYSGFSIPAQPEYNDGDGWTREHVWAKSRGNFGTDKGAGTDVHHLRAEDNSTNTARNNRNFAESNDPFVDDSGTYQGTTGSYTGRGRFTWEPRAAVKGDVARMIFYMATRYEGEGDEPDLEIVDSLLTQSENQPVHSRLYDLIAWHKEDPVDESEQNRNEIVYGYQGNRNPFIDHPEWVTEIWGDLSEPKVEFDKYGFNDNFDAVSFGESIVQSYFINAYYLSDDLTVSVDQPFYISAEEAGNYSGQVTFTNGEKISDNFQVYLKFEPQQSSENGYSTEVSHTSAGMHPVSFTVTGQEGEGSAVQTIAEAREKSLGTKVTVSGVVIGGANNNRDNRAIYDGTAGILVRSFDEGNESANLQIGDSVTVRGLLGDYNNLLQISESPIIIDILKDDAKLPEPQVVQISEIGETHESELVTIENVGFMDTGHFEGGGAQGNFLISDGQHVFTFRLGSSSHPLVSTEIPSGKVNITGIIGQFGDDYQISPRSEEDVEVLLDPLQISANNSEISMFPNPVSAAFKIQSQYRGKVRVVLVDASGRIVLRKRIKTSEEIDISNLIEGIYFVHISLQNKSFTQKIIKQ